MAIGFKLAFTYSHATQAPLLILLGRMIIGVVISVAAIIILVVHTHAHHYEKREVSSQ